MSFPRPARPWWCHDRATEEYKQTLSDGSQFPMLKSLKIIRAIVVNVGLFVGWFYTLRLGGDPTFISAIAFAVIGAYNGLEVTDYLALLRAYKEVQQSNTDE